MQKDADRPSELVDRALDVWRTQPRCEGSGDQAELDYALQAHGIVDRRPRLDTFGEIQLTLAAVTLAKELKIAEETCNQLERDNADLALDLEDKEEVVQDWRRKYDQLQQQHLDDVARLEHMLQADMNREAYTPKEFHTSPLSSNLVSMQFNDFRSRDYDTFKSYGHQSSIPQFDEQRSTEELEARFQELCAENAALKTDYNSLKVELQDLNSQEAIRKDMEAEMTRTIEQLQKQIEKMVCKGDECQCHHCKELKEEITALEQALMWERENKISSVNSASSKQATEEFEERITALRSKNEDLKTKAASYERSLNSKNAENAQLQASITYLTNQIENLTEEVERTKKALYEAEASISSMKAAEVSEVRKMPSCISISGDLMLDPSPQRSPSTRGSPTASSETDEDEVRKLKIKLKALMSRVDGLNNELLDTRAELKTALQKQFLTQAKSEEQISALMDEKLKLVAQLQDMEPQVVTVNEENARLRAEQEQLLTSKKTLQERINQLEREIGSLSSRMNDSDLIHSDLRKRIKELEHELCNLESLVTANDRLKDQLGTLESERKVLMEKVSTWSDFVKESFEAAMATDDILEGDATPTKYFRSSSATSRIGDARKKSPPAIPLPCGLSARYSSNLVDMLGDTRAILEPVVADLVVLSQGTMKVRKLPTGANKKLDSLSSRVFNTSLDPNVDILTQLKSPLVRDIWKRILRQQRYARRSSVDIAGLQLGSSATMVPPPIKERKRTLVSFGTGWDRVTCGSRRCGRWNEGFTLCLAITYQHTDQGLMESVRTWSCKRSLPVAEIHTSRVMYSEEHIEAARRAMPLLKYIDSTDSPTPSTARAAL